MHEWGRIVVARLRKGCGLRGVGGSQRTQPARGCATARASLSYGGFFHPCSGGMRPGPWRGGGGGPPWWALAALGGGGGWGGGRNGAGGGGGVGGGERG